MLKKHILTILCMLSFLQISFAQSALYVYKNTQANKGDFMLVHGMPSRADAEFFAKQKLSETVNDTEWSKRYAATDQKGFGVVIQATLNLPNNKKMPLYGASLGQTDAKAAEQLAVANLKRMNPEWKTGNYTVILQIEDK